MPTTRAPAAPLTDADLAQVLAAEARPLGALAVRMMGTPEDAADVLQEAWLRAWRGRRGLRDPRTRRGWLRQIVVRECLRALRRRRMRRWLPFGAEVPSVAAPGDLTAAGDVARVQRVVAGLPPRQRLVWGLRMDEGWTLPEISAATGIGRETVKTHLKRALRRVRDELGVDDV